ncbi:MAG: AraC family transcriptional regulator [Nocardiaceae bacterium]|nr:AraC family transcriptional regulator [Nocardiaceae bacterium]
MEDCDDIQPIADDRAQAMTQDPDTFADAPDASILFPSVAGDALSELLQLVSLRGDAVARFAPTPPFRVDIPKGVRALHIAETAGVVVETAEGRITLDAGDMVLVARGDSHHVSSDDAAGWVSGTFVLNNESAGTLLDVLPSAIRVRAAGRPWLPLSLNLLLEELKPGRPGAGVMISRILDLLFIHALREWSSTNGAQPGWLTAALDRQLAPVLTAIHAHPEHRWTVADLAHLANQSRSVFAERFTRLLGQSPAAYVASRRLEKAAALLETDEQSVSQVARAVGFESDAAFSRAFTREFGVAPSRWRKRN